MRAVRQAPAHNRATGEARPALTWRVAAAFAMAVCLVLVVQVAVVQHAKIEQRRIADLRAEQHRIEAELAVVKKQASTYEPVFILEHSDGTRVVVDQTPRDPAIVPASYTFD